MMWTLYSLNVAKFVKEVKKKHKVNFLCYGGRVYNKFLLHCVLIADFYTLSS